MQSVNQKTQGTGMTVDLHPTPMGSLASQRCLVCDARPAPEGPSARRRGPPPAGLPSPATPLLRSREGAGGTYPLLEGTTPAKDCRAPSWLQLGACVGRLCSLRLLQGLSWSVSPSCLQARREPATGRRRQDKRSAQRAPPPRAASAQHPARPAPAGPRLLLRGGLDDVGVPCGGGRRGGGVIGPAGALPRLPRRGPTSAQQQPRGSSPAGAPRAPGSVMVRTHTRCSFPQAVPSSTLLPE